MLTVRVVEDLEWRLNAETPNLKLPNGESVWRVDPYPCYAHDQYLVREEAKEDFQKFRIPEELQPEFYLLRYDTLERVNGWTQRRFTYGDIPEPRLRQWHPHIVLTGKRIPLHPAMTRYLVAHEYGHVVDYYLQRFYSDDDPSRSDSGFDKIYREIRKFPDPDEYYGGPTWSRDIGEIIANDFRILVLQKETEFWPHHLPRPENLPAVIDFWEKAKQHAVPSA